MEWLRDTAARREFDGFVAEVSDRLLRTGYLMTGDTRDAEDLVQEALLKVARRWHRVRSMDYPAAYARRVLVNLILGDARRRQRTELLPGDAAGEAADDRAARALRDVDDQAEFRWALAQLPLRSRAVLVLRYWADLPIAEVASTASRAASRLADILRDLSPVPPALRGSI